MTIIWPLVVFTLIVTYGLTKQLVLDDWSIWTKKIIKTIIWVMGIAVAIVLWNRHLIMSYPQSWWTQLAFITLGVFDVVAIFTMCRFAFLLLINKTLYNNQHNPYQVSRREFFKRSSLLGVAVGSPLYLSHAYGNATRLPAIVNVPVKIKGLPLPLESLKIIQVSDLHIGQILNPERVLNHLVTTINQADPDLVMFTGDIVDGAVSDLAHWVEQLKGVKARYGIFYVTGNHEFYSDGGAWIQYFKDLGWQVLENSSQRLLINGASLNIAGVHDFTAGRFFPEKAFNLNAALQDCDPNAPTILLSHRPNAAEFLVEQRVDLQLSGHTHAGQFAPATWFIYAFHQYVKGLQKVKSSQYGAQVYVNSGTGYWGPPLRSTEIAGEITLIELQTAAS